VKGYLAGLPKGLPVQGQMPKRSDLATSGHHNVRYALQVRESSLLITASGENKARITEVALHECYLYDLPKGSPVQGQMPALSDLAASEHYDDLFALQYLNPQQP
jgi:hypothetical protein